MKGRCQSLKTILIVNQKGGVGKTMLADEIAFYYDRRGIDCSFYDLDGQGGAIHETSNITANIGVVDTPGALQADMNKWIDTADVIIVPTRATTRDIPPLQTMLDMIEQAGKQKKTIIVINCFNHYTAAADFREWVKGEYPDYKVFTVVQSELFVQAAAYGKSVVDYKGNSTAADNIKTLTKAINKMIERN